ncbi:hypothetical protein [Streptomyces albidoflavus]|uniref:hypothetical protein n=1 Tax=Streptomyces albidoflavus TaxID=1886 RepID=UPI0033234A78
MSGEDRRVGRADGPLVGADDVTVVDGEVTGQTDDAYIVGEGDEARAWPKATWELVPEPKSSGKGE